MSLYPEWGIFGAWGIETGSIIVHLLPQFDEIVNDNLTKDTFEDFSNALEAAISHELVHGPQFQKIIAKGSLQKIADEYDRKKDNPKEYRAISIEIMAFAQQSFKEFLRAGYSTQDILEFLRKPSTVSPDDSYIFCEYLELFGANHKIFKQFSNYIYQYCMNKK